MFKLEIHITIFSMLLFNFTQANAVAKVPQKSQKDNSNSNSNGNEISPVTSSTNSAVNQEGSTETSVNLKTEKSVSINQILQKPGLVNDILWGKIPGELLEIAGGKIRPPYFKWPVPGGRFGRGFGSGKDGRHKALDIVAPAGTPVLAAARGLVVWADEKNGYGNAIIILHSGGWVTLYAHLSKFLVKRGMIVKSRQKIGLVGNTGISRGPHLHFMFFDNGVLRDPAPLMHPSIPHLPHVPPMPMQGYSVKKGDTIPKIASKFGLEESAIIDANGLKGGSDIRPGWRIIIPLPASSKTFERGVYTVKKGDTISAIAVLYDVSVKELMALNGLKKDSALTPGMKLKLPEGTYDGKALSNIGGILDDDTTEDYTIKEGDSLFSVAKKYNTSVTKIAFLNGIKDPAKIKPGMKIQIPVKKEKGVSKSKKSQKTKKNGQTTPGPEETETKASEAESEESIFPPLNQEDLDIGKVEKGENEE